MAIEIERKIIRVGCSLGVSLPKKILETKNLKEGDRIAVTITPIKKSKAENVDKAIKEFGKENKLKIKGVKIAFEEDEDEKEITKS